jgi:hypothetical protein
MTREQLQRELGFSKSYTCARIKEGMPTDSIESAKQWLDKNQKRGKPGVRSKAPKPAATVLINDGNSTLEDAVQRLQGNERAVSEAINETTAALLLTSDPKQGTILSNQLSDLRKEQKQVVTALAKSENDLVKLQRTRGQLISIDEAKSLISKCLASAVTGLKKFPQSGANPEEQARLSKIADGVLAEIFRTAQEHIAEKELAGV